MNDLELFEKARRRVQNKIKGRCVTNKDVIVDQEREILYYRDKIERMITSKQVEFETKTFYADGEIIRTETIYYK